MNEISLKYEDYNYLLIRLFEVNKEIDSLPYPKIYEYLKANHTRGLRIEDQF